jgi:hypothetical protein
MPLKFRRMQAYRNLLPWRGREGDVEKGLRDALQNTCYVAVVHDSVQ